MTLTKALSALTLAVSAMGLAQAAPIVYSGMLTSGVTGTGDVPHNSYSSSANWDYWSFAGNAGDVITITVNRTSDQMDPGVNLYAGTGVDSAGLSFGSSSSSIDGFLTFLAYDDDSGSSTPSGPFRNSLISNFTLTSSGMFTIAVFDVLGNNTGPWTYGVTVLGATGTIPEPGSFALAGLALAGLMLGSRKKQAA